MRVLVVSSTPWASNNSFGSSFSNIFEGIEGLEFANIYCQHGEPSNTLVERYLQITEKSLLANLLHPSRPPCRRFTRAGSEPATSGIATDGGVVEAYPDDLTSTELKAWDFLRSRRLQVLYWVRDLIWALGRWRSQDFRDFVREFDPDLIFQPVYYAGYMNDVALHAHSLVDAPMVGYISDDNYTLRQFSLSPLYWVDRLVKRRKVKRLIDNCEYLYVISEVQQREYSKVFRKRCEILTKCVDFDGTPPETSVATEPPGSEGPLSLVYTGNIGGGRWRSLALIARALAEMNRDRALAELSIYTSTPLTTSMRQQLAIPGSSRVFGSVTAEEAATLQREGDILVHVEGLDLASRLRVHQSFSTKIVEYLACARCILAVGPRGVASMEYLISNDAGLVASSYNEVSTTLARLVRDPRLRMEYGVKAWESGRRNHNRRQVQERLSTQLKSVVAQAGGVE